MPEPVVLVTMGDDDPALVRHVQGAGRVRGVDCYRLCPETLAGAAAILVGVHVDQRHLRSLSPMLDSFVAAGGRAVICGQVAIPFLTGLSLFRPLERYGVDDLVVHALQDHPVWAGVDLGDVTFTRGVAGFYGRGWHQPPDEALVVNGLGPSRLPLDYVYPLGSGEVLVHGGNDLWDWAEATNSSARLTPQLLEWTLR
jgi:hypothetical protein